MTTYYPKVYELAVTIDNPLSNSMQWVAYVRHLQACARNST